MSNLAQYIPDVRIYVGDIDSTTFSDSTILTALENGVMYLSTRWYNKYLLYSSGIVNSLPANPGYQNVNTPDGMCTILDTFSEGDVFRNCHRTFTSEEPPVMEQQDVPALLIATSYLLRRAIATSSSVGLSWSTPDLSFSNIQSSRIALDMMKQELAALEFFFKLKLGRMQIGRFGYQVEMLQPNYYVQAANWIFRMANERN